MPWLFAAGAAGGAGGAAGGAGAGAAGAGAGGLGGASTAALGAAPLAASGAEAVAGAVPAAAGVSGAAPAAGGIMESLHQLLGQAAQIGGPGVPSTGGSGILGQVGMGGTANNFLRGFAQGYNLPVQTFQAPGFNASTFGQLLGQRALGGGGNGGQMPQTPDAAQLLALLQQLQRRPFQ